MDTNVFPGSPEKRTRHGSGTAKRRAEAGAGDRALEASEADPGCFRCPSCGTFLGKAGSQSRRSEALRMHARGMGVSEIAGELRVTRMAVYQWLKHYAPDGSPLKQGRRGRRPTIGPNELARLRTLTAESPTVYGINRESWSPAALGQLTLKVFQVRLGAESARRLRQRLANDSPVGRVPRAVSATVPRPNVTEPTHTTENRQLDKRRT